MEELTKKKIETWLEGNFDAQTKEEIQQMSLLNPDELEDAFYRDLEFGTGGMRGIMGVGTNRMNRYTVAMATQGLANYIKQVTEGELKVAIAYDSRNNSGYFAKVAANVLSANGIFVYLFDELRPTPELSFAIRRLDCVAGIVITASHNPKEYNGYKVYWSDGGQLVPPHDKAIVRQIRQVQTIDDIRIDVEKTQIQSIGSAIDNAYIEAVKTLSQNPDMIDVYGDIGIVYSPLHGSGVKIVPQALKAFGFDNVHLLAPQAVTDGNFPTVLSPNPEEAEALSMAIEYAQKNNCDLVLATDPDCDRVGVAIKDKNGEFVLLNGNQTAALIVYYMCEQWAKKEKLTGKQYIVKTIVTTDLLTKIAASYDVETIDVLTGFKYIAQKIAQNEPNKEFLCGGEESFGYLVGDFVRDKDAVISCCIIAEIAAYAVSRGSSLLEMLTEIYLQFGCYQEKLLSITKKGKDGLEAIERMMDGYRKCPPTKINHEQVVRIDDYKTQTSNNLLTHKLMPISLPVSDVIQFFLSDGSKITVRPSGTEPKIKFYLSVQMPLSSKEQQPYVEQQLEKKLLNIKRELNL